MLIAVALGGNALLQRGERPDEVVQRRHAAQAARALAPLTSEHQLLICHGNGPQIGNLALESEHDSRLTRAYPLDALGALTQGLIGYWLVQELTNAGVPAPVLGVLTQTVVDADDPAFSRPSKPIGEVYDEITARAAAKANRWQMGPDGQGWRRLVPSPAPVSVVEEAVIATLLVGRATVVCGGGGGVPVVRTGSRLRGVDAVVDKDLTASVLAAHLHADMLLILTDVPGVMAGFGTANASLVRELRVEDIDVDRYPAGSMAPKLRACAGFVRATGKEAAIGSLEAAGELLTGRTGSRIVAG